MFDISSHPLAVTFIIGLAAILVVSEFGWQLGIRNNTGSVGSNFSTLESAILGLLALMLAFTFSMALTRFEARRDAVLNEANAIGTTALRARLLAEPYRTDSLKLLKEYVQIRLDIAQSDRSLAETASAIERSNAIQETLWLQAKAVAASDT